MQVASAHSPSLKLYRIVLLNNLNGCRSIEPFIILPKVQWQGNNLALTNLIYCWDQRILKILKKNLLTSRFWIEILHQNLVEAQHTVWVKIHISSIWLYVFFLSVFKRSFSVFSFHCIFVIISIEEYVKSTLRHLHLYVFHLLATLHHTMTKLLTASLTAGDVKRFCERIKIAAVSSTSNKAELEQWWWINNHGAWALHWCCVLVCFSA